MWREGSYEPSANHDLTGVVFGDLVVLYEVGRNRNGKRSWLCRCSCGTFRQADGGSLRTNRWRSCGCLRGRNIALGKPYYSTQRAL